MANPDSDPGTIANPLDAMALAPAEALIEPKVALAAAPPAPRPANASPVETDVGSTKPTCREGVGEGEGDCIRVRVVRPLRALNERPLIAAAPIGHRNDPTVLPASPSARAEARPSPAAPAEKSSVLPAPAETAIAEAIPADIAPAAEPIPPAPAPRVTSNKSRPRVHHVRNESRSSRRNGYSYTARSSYSFQGGWGRLW